MSNRAFAPPLRKLNVVESERDLVINTDQRS